MIGLAHKIPLYPDQQGDAHFRRAAGIARFAWNWALARWKAKYEAENERCRATPSSRSSTPSRARSSPGLPRSPSGPLRRVSRSHAWTHFVTSRLVRAYKQIGMEDLNVKAMTKLRSLARKIGEACWGEIRRQLSYKTALAGGELFLADRFYPSTKTCSGCGHILGEISLGVRSWVCPACGAGHDRDVNASINLKPSNIVARARRWETLNACGGAVSRRSEGSALAAAAPAKQEPDEDC